jgi:uncharacterized protein
MSTATEAQMDTQAKTKAQAASVVWFEVPADNPERAKSFYNALFGWKIEPFPGAQDYWHIDTGGSDESLDGGLMARKGWLQSITHYISVPSVDESAAKVEQLGGKVCQPKTAIPQMGFYAICQDTEKNTFGLWEMAKNAQ